MSKTWRCFHCDEVFRTVAGAAEHFGDDQTGEPACKISAKSVTQIIAYIRRLQRDLRKAQNALHSENYDGLLAYQQLRADVDQQVRRAEEQGYARGLADAGYTDKGGIC